MKKLGFILAIAILVAALPLVSFTEDTDTVRLARVIYAMAGADSYEAKLAVGSVVMNRVDSPWFPATLGEVLRQKHQFPWGDRYDSQSLSAAHAVLSGKRTLEKDVLYLQAIDATQPWEEEPVRSIGGYNFFTQCE